MKKTGVIKRGMFLFIILTMVLGMAVNVSAATHTTTTTYEIGSDTVAVRSEVSGLSGEQQVAYLAYNRYKGANPNSGNIVFIDQKYVGENVSSCVFEYSANVADIGSTLVKFGTNNSDGFSLGSGATDQVIASQVNVTKEGDGVITPMTTAQNTLFALSGKQHTFMIAPAPGSKIASLTYDGNDVHTSTLIPNHNGVVSYTISNVTSDKTLHVVFNTNTTDQSRVVKAMSYNQVLNKTGEGDIANNQITAYSAFITPDSDVSNYQYGMVLSYVPLDIELSSEQLANWWNNAVVEGSMEVEDGLNGFYKKFQAMGRGSNGSYAIRLINGQSTLLADKDKYYMTPYLIENLAGEYSISFGRAFIFED